MGRKIIAKLLIVGLLGATMATQTACIGSFSLTRGLLSWNQSLGHKFVNWLVFLAFVIIPVYGIAILADALVFNSLEFWTGSNPMAEGEVEDTRRVAVNDKFELLFHRVSAEEMTVAIIEDGEVKQTLSMTVKSDGMIVRDGTGTVIARLQQKDGMITVYNALNQVIAEHTAEESDELTEVYQEAGARGLTDMAVERMQDSGNGFADLR